MRVSDSSSGTGAAPGRPAARLAERYRLSYGGHVAGSRVGARRRVFARLAPHSSELATGSSEPAGGGGGYYDDDDDDDDGSDGGGEFMFDGNADQYFDTQMMLLPPTPPRRRAIDADSMDSGSESDDGDGPAGRGPAAERSTGDGWLGRQALAHFGQQQRHRFLHTQHQRHGAATAGAAGAVGMPGAAMAPQRPWITSRAAAVGLGAPAPSSHDAAAPLFPSNDVDSYWYNQPVAASAAAIAPGFRPAALRRSGRLPSVPRNPAAEISRHAMLEVLQTRRSFAPTGDGDSDDSDASTASGSPIRGHAATDDAGRTEKPEALDNDCDGDCVASSGALGAAAAWRAGLQAQTGRAPAEKRLMRWLSKYTVDVRSLDCALLRPGIRFTGIQQISPPAGGCMNTEEQWDVRVEIETVDMARGRVTGLMKAINVPRLPKTIVTYWEGEVIDFVNYMPLTNKWQATCSSDVEHWSLFAAVRAHQEGFLHEWPESMRGRRMPQVLEEYILMRWKETSFVNVHASETGLTIEGFYYVCMSRRTGSLEGVYFEPSTRPYQRLVLNVDCGERGMSFASAASC
ncbi:hypothetical protein LPJ61_002977 [Coemansia biformis]|uniref:Vacuolar import and degradation protein-domain-containing protein n=1 Tax=Coemansia biformis TaxID=1286918 RepID=A0A9W7YD01_9FUNG|nr:hypothetical protein LPJ61_002977 [Coemansia biformis]